jgi:hypothetical protein
VSGPGWGATGWAHTGRAWRWRRCSGVSQLPISVCLIVRDAQDTLGAALASVRPHVAEVCVLDTGSVDGTLAVASRYADKLDRAPWQDRFDTARNTAHAMASQPWVMWLDADDVLEGGAYLAEAIDGTERPAVVSLPYHAAGVVYDRERLVSPGWAWRWEGWAHEVLVPAGARGTFRHSRSDKVRVRHTKVGNSGDRNLRILRAQRAAEGDSERLLFYLGRELAEHGYGAEATEALEAYLRVGQWDGERFHARVGLSCLHLARRDWDGAVREAMGAIGECPAWCEGYCQAARVFYYRAQHTGAREDWARCVEIARMGLAKPLTVTPVFLDPKERAGVHRFLNVALARVGDVPGALASVELGLAAYPRDPNMVQNRRTYRRALGLGGLRLEAVG